LFAVAAAGAARVDVSVVTELASRGVHDAISAGVPLAVGIAYGIATGVAILGTTLHIPITTPGPLARIGAAILVAAVAVVALLSGAGSHDAITAPGGLTRRRAVIVIAGVAVVALLSVAGAQDAITAPSDLTRGRAAIIVDGVVVIALLAGMDVHDAITAFAVRTVVIAGGGLASGITLLGAWILLVYLSITADGDLAADEAVVLVAGVAVVTLLVGIADAIATTLS
jgi:hypothetical protein